MQPSIANHTQTHHCKQTHHHHNTDTTKSTKNQTNPHTDIPQNQPKIKYTHTVTHQQRQRAELLPPYGYGFVLGTWKSTRMSLNAFGGDRSFWVNWNKSLWIGACGGSVLVDRCL